MNNKEILDLAIKKAEKNGYMCMYNLDAISNIEVEKFPENFWHIIFSHEFAKAFWGEEKYIAYYAGYDEWADATKKVDRDSADYDEVQHERKPEWEYHLQQMVLEEDKIKYLEQFLD